MMLLVIKLSKSWNKSPVSGFRHCVNESESDFLTCLCEKILCIYLLFDSQTNDGEEELEEKKRKIVKNKKKKQKETKEKTEAFRKKKHMNHAAIKVMDCCYNT